MVPNTILIPLTRNQSIHLSPRKSVQLQSTHHIKSTALPSQARHFTVTDAQPRPECPCLIDCCRCRKRTLLSCSWNQTARSARRQHLRPLGDVCRLTAEQHTVPHACVVFVESVIEPSGEPRTCHRFGRAARSTRSATAFAAHGTARVGSAPIQPTWEALPAFRTKSGALVVARLVTQRLTLAWGRYEDVRLRCQSNSRRRRRRTLPARCPRAGRGAVRGRPVPR